MAIIFLKEKPHIRRSILIDGVSDFDGMRSGPYLYMVEKTGKNMKIWDGNEIPSHIFIPN